MATDVGDLISRLKLDLSDYQSKLTQAQKQYQAAFGKMDKSAQKSSKSMSKSMEDHSKRSSKAARRVEKSWWETFGRVAVGFTIAYRAMNAFEEGLRKLVGTFSDGIQTIDEFRVAIAETSAALQMLTEQPSIEGLEAYLDFSRKTFKDLEIIAAKHLSTGEDLRMAYAKMATMAIVPVGEEQLEDMARLVDLVILSTRGLDKERQIRTEIQALVNGQMRQGAVIARMLQQRVANYDDLIDRMQQTASVEERTNILLTMLDKVLSSVGSVSEEILKTHTAWKATLEAVFNRIQRAGLNQMYEDLMETMIKIRDATMEQGKFTELGVTITKMYHDAWASVWAVIVPVARVLADIVVLGNQLFGITRILKGWAGLLTIILGGWEQLGYLIQGNIEGAFKASDRMMQALEDIYMTREEFQRKYIKNTEKMSKEILKYLKKLTAGGDEASKQAKENLEEWIDDVEDLETKYQILSGTLKSVKASKWLTPEDLESFEWLWKTTTEWQEVPDELKSRWMDVQIALSKVNAELEKAGKRADALVELSELREEYAILGQIYEELKRGEISVEEIDKRQKIVELEHEYLELVTLIGEKEAAEWLLFQKGLLALKGRIKIIEDTDEALRKLTDDWIEASGEAVENMAEGVDDAMEDFDKKLNRLERRFKDTFKQPRDLLNEALELIDLLEAAGRLTAEQAKSATDVAWREYAEAQYGADIGIIFENWDKFINESGDIWKTAVEDAGGSFLGAVGLAGVIWAEMAIAMVQAIESLITLPQRFYDASSSLLDAVADWPITFLESLDKFIFKFIDLVPNFISALIQAIGDYLPDLIDRVIEEIPRVINALIDLLPQLMEAVTKSSFDIGKSILSAPLDIVKGIFGGDGDGGPTLTQRQQAAWNAFLSGLRETYGHISNIQSELDDVNSQFKEWRKALKDARVAEEYLEKVRREQVKVLQDLIKAEERAIKTGIIDTLLGAIAPSQLEQLNIVREFASVVEAIRDLEEASGESYDELVTLTEQAYAQEMINALKQTEAFQNLEESLNKWEDLLRDIRDQILDLETSLANPADIFERMAVMEEEIASIAGANWQEGFDASALTAEEVAELQGLLGDYLELGQEAWQRPSNQYQNLYDLILNSLGILESQVEEQVSEYELSQKQLTEQTLARLSLENIESIIDSQNTSLENIESFLENIAQGILKGLPIELTIDLSGQVPGEVTVPVSIPPEALEVKLPPPTFDITPWWKVPGGAEPGWAMREFEQKSGRQPGWALEEFYQGSNKNIGIGYAEHGALASGPESGYPMMLHGIELITPWDKVKEMGSTTYNLSIAVNESQRPGETAREVRSEIESFMRSSKGGKIIQNRSKGRT